MELRENSGSPAPEFPGSALSDDVLDHCPDAVIVLDVEWRIVYVNRRALAIAGRGAAELLARPVSTVWPALMTAEVEQQCRAALQAGAATNAECQTAGVWGNVRICRCDAGVALFCRGPADSEGAFEQETTRSLYEGLAAFVEWSDDAIIGKDLDGIIRSWNRGAERIFGYTAAEAIGKPVSILTPEGRPDELPGIMERIRRGERIPPYPTERRAKDGTIVPVSLAVSPIRDAAGKVRGASKVARDISVEGRYHEVREHLASIVKSSDDAIISKDLNGIIRSWNRGAERIFGYTAAEAIGRPVTMLAAPERIDEIPNIIERITRGERIDHYETRRRAKDGRILAVSLTVSPIRDSSGKIVGASKIARDITDQQSNQEALRQANESLKRSNADLEHFAYSASHDLQEPLRMIAVYSQLLLKSYGGRLGDTGNEYLKYVIEGAGRMEQLLTDLRTFTQASTMKLEPAPAIDANEALQRALENLGTAIEETGASITWDALPCVRVHGFQLSQLFQNLIGNALRYRSEEAPRVHVGAERCGQEWKFSVRDNGIGIEPQYQEQIFGLFKRLHPAAKYPGTGMGLAICLRIVERAGGRIWVESAAGEGATFFFTLPVQAESARIE